MIEALSSVGEAVVRKFAERAVGVAVPAGTEIVGYLEASTDVYYLIKGTLRASIIAESGRQVTYHLIKPGESFGELSATDGDPRSLTIEAETDSILARLSSRDFLELVRTEPEFALAVLNTMASLARFLSDKVFEDRAYDVKGRVYLELLSLSEEAGGDAFRVTDRDMGSRVGTTRENVTRIYKQLRDDQIIQRDSQSIRVLDAGALKGLLEDSQFS